MNNVVTTIQELDGLAESILGMDIEPQIIYGIDIPVNMHDAFKKAMRLDPPRAHLLYQFLEYAVNFSLDGVDIETIQEVIRHLELTVLLDDMLAIIDGVRYIVNTVNEKYKVSSGYKPHIFYIGVDMLSVNSNVVGIKIYAEDYNG